MKLILKHYFLITISSVLFCFLAKTFLLSNLIHLNFERALDGVLPVVVNLLYIFLLTLPFSVWSKCKKDFLAVTTLSTLALFSFVFGSDFLGVFGDGQEFNDFRLFFTFTSFLLLLFVEIASITFILLKNSAS